MGGFVFAAPYVPPVPDQSVLWPGLRFIWDGWDGSTWDLTARTSGVFLRAMRGLGIGPYQRAVSSSPAVDGTRFRGSRALEREVFWDLSVYSDQGSQAWLDYDAAFFHTLDVDRQGVLTVVQPSGAQRTLPLRYVDGADPLLATDPSRTGWGRYGVYLVAEAPYWRGTAESRLFTPSTPAPFFPGPPFTISEGSVASTAAITNLGDVPAWPEWWVAGPMDTATVGVGDRVVEIPFAIDAGRMVVVTTRPERRVAYEIDAPAQHLPVEDQAAWVASQLATAGTNRTKELGAVKFAPVPAGGSAPLEVDLVGTGWVRVSITPQYKRAW